MGDGLGFWDWIDANGAMAGAIVGGALNALALALITFITLTAEQRRDARHEEAQRRRLARSLAAELDLSFRSSLDTLGDTLRVADVRKRAPAIGPFPVFENNTNMLGLLDDETVRQLIVIYSGVRHVKRIAEQYEDWRLQNVPGSTPSSVIYEVLDISPEALSDHLDRLRGYADQHVEHVIERLHAIADGRRPPATPDSVKMWRWED
jgi:gamma-glutamylcyclotransferase (GGCT)/AIG2-like uncharacterized protein YtfP